MNPRELLHYLYRCAAWNAVNIDDCLRFPALPIRKAGTPSVFTVSKERWPLAAIRYTYKQQPRQEALLPFLQQTGTTALIVIKDGVVVFEDYFNGYSRDSINTSFSVAKGIVSLLTGIALDEGLIGSAGDPIGRYLDHLPAALQPITIHHLLNMTSGIRYREGALPWSDDATIYYGMNLRRKALQGRVAEPAGSHYHYCNYNLLLLGLVLEKAAGMSPALYTQEKLWQPLGAEQDASWSADAAPQLFCKMESGFNATAMDFARLAMLCLQKGAVGGRQVVPEHWMEQLFTPPAHTADTRKYYSRQVPPLCRWVESPYGYYRNLWGGYKTGPAPNDLFALGALGQLLYVSPRKNTIVVRFGKKWGKVDWWPGVLKGIVEEL